jgi:archaellum component FlaC
MNKNRIAIVFAALVFAFALAQPAAAGTQEQLIQIQTQLQLVQDNMTRMQQSFDERMGVMKDMITQQTDNVNKMGTAVQQLQKTLSSQTTDASSKVDQISGQVQMLHDAVDELKTRLAKVTKQLDDMQAARQNIGTPPPGAPATGNVTPAPPRPNK